ncbi:MAG: response regulator [Candidatus Melainabacteria bacterium]|jgi:diguanylate cyclase (GGDEF)-like protein|nr:response regulator [Candidatus Melainabacteria bacterium]
MGKNILLVEQDKTFLKLIVPVLEGRGHKVFQAETGKEGQGFIQKENLDMVILGSPLPDSNCLDWLTALRATGNKIPVTYIASSQPELHANKERLERELGVVLAVNKPVIPFVFGAQLEGKLSPEDPQSGKLKDFETMFLALVSKYARMLPSKLDDLAVAISKSKEDPDDASLVAEVRSQAHKIKGTGGSLGFRQVSDCMFFIENAAATMHEKPAKEQTALWADVERKLADAKILGEKEAADVASVVNSKEEETAGQEAPASMARILVVDSDDGFLDIVEALGKQRLVEIVRAKTFREALDRACILPLDAALVNVHAEAPDESFKLARELRNLPGYETLPLAFISGNALVKDRVEAAHAGASLYLDKPLESDSLEKAVEHLVSIRTGGRPRILLVDDDEFFANTIALILRNEGVIVRILTDPNKILEVMQDFPPELLLLDVMMPGITGFEVCRMLRQIPRWQDLPIVFLTGQTGVENRLEAFRSGGDDYLPKPVVNEELLTRVKVRLDRARMLKDRSDKDTITGLLLRRAFSEQLAQLLAEGQRNKTVFTICLIDVDKFKNVNDTYGHLAGDKVLAGLGQLLARRFRVEDLRGRWGGEEFILGFRRESKETMHAAINRVLAEFREMIFTGDDGREFKVSFSGGMASFPEDGESVYELIQTADARLYEAKKQGRNRIILSHDKEKSVTASTQ